jgi:hypothetical protein
MNEQKFLKKSCFIWSYLVGVLILGRPRYEVQIRASFVLQFPHIIRLSGYKYLH